jgi:hypothetical protein
MANAGPTPQASAITLSANGAAMTAMPAST